jgi:type I restriction enzyme R subunit
MSKKDLSERGICSKFIGPGVKRAGWDGMMQIREEVNFTKGRIIVRGKLVTRGKAKRADYILYYKPNIPIAVIEARTTTPASAPGCGRPSTTPSPSISRLCCRLTATALCFTTAPGRACEKEATLSLDAFPSANDLWSKCRAWKGLTSDEEEIILQDYFDDGSCKAPRYYQTNAVNATIGRTPRLCKSCCVTLPSRSRWRFTRRQ